MCNVDLMPSGVKKTYMRKAGCSGRKRSGFRESLSICRQQTVKEMEILLVNIAAAVIYGMITFNSFREGRKSSPLSPAEEQ